MVAEGGEKNGWRGGGDKVSHWSKKSIRNTVNDCNSDVRGQMVAIFVVNRA